MHVIKRKVIRVMDDSIEMADVRAFMLELAELSNDYGLHLTCTTTMKLRDADENIIAVSIQWDEEKEEYEWMIV